MHWRVIPYLVMAGISMFALVFVVANDVRAADGDGWTNDATVTGTVSTNPATCGDLQTIVSDVSGTISNVRFFGHQSNVAANGHEIDICDTNANCYIGSGSTHRLAAGNINSFTTSDDWASINIDHSFSVTAGSSYYVKYCGGGAGQSVLTLSTNAHGIQRRATNVFAAPSPTISATSTGSVFAPQFGYSGNLSPQTLSGPVLPAYVRVINAGFGINETYTVSASETAAQRFETSPAINIRNFPNKNVDNFYTLVITQPGVGGTGYATSTVDIEQGNVGAGFGGGGGGSWGDEPGAPGITTGSVSSYSSCLELSTAAFTCFFSVTKDNIEGLPIISIFTSLPANWSYVTSATAAPINLTVGVPPDTWTLYDSSSTTVGVVGAVGASWWTGTWLPFETGVINVFSLVVLVIIAYSFKKSLS